MNIAWHTVALSALVLQLSACTDSDTQSAGEGGSAAAQVGTGGGAGGGGLGVAGDGGGGGECTCRDPVRFDCPETLDEFCAARYCPPRLELWLACAQELTVPYRIHEASGLTVVYDVYGYGDMNSWVYDTSGDLVGAASLPDILDLHQSCGVGAIGIPDEADPLLSDTGGAGGAGGTATTGAAGSAGSPNCTL